MKRMLAAALVCVMMLSMPCAFADAHRQITEKSYALEAFSVYRYTSLNGKYETLEVGTTSGVEQKANAVELRYDYETEKNVRRGRFEEDGKTALIAVGGWDEDFERIADAQDLLIFINGEPLNRIEGADYADAVGWVNHFKDMSSHCVVFPLALTEQGGLFDFEIEVTGKPEDVWLTERAEITVKLVNTHEYKEERTLTIPEMEAVGMNAYIVGGKIYLDHWKGVDPGNSKLTLTLGDENGAPFAQVAYLQKPRGEESGFTPFVLQDAAAEIRLKDSQAVLQPDPLRGLTDCKEIQFVVETKNATYSAVYDVVHRMDAEWSDPKGIHFAQAERVLGIGETFTPEVLGIATDEAIEDFTLRVADGAQAGIVDLTDEKTLIGIQEGITCVAASYTLPDGRVYDTASMRILVIAAEQTAEAYRVICRNLNVRAGAGTQTEKVRMAHRGEVLPVRNVTDGWAELMDGTFVAAAYLEKVK